MKVLVLYYSTYGHIHKMAKAIAEGVSEVDGAEAVPRRVPETLPPEVLEKMGAVEAQKGMVHVPVATVDELASADAVIFGTPTRFGNMCGQMRQFLDARASSGPLRPQPRRHSPQTPTAHAAYALGSLLVHPQSPPSLARQPPADRLDGHPPGAHAARGGAAVESDGP